MVRHITLAALVAALLLPAAADAVVRKGQYAGKTEQDARIGFNVLNKTTLVQFSWQGAVMECSDGDNRQIEGGRTSRGDPIRIRNGRFEFGGTLGDAAELAVAGRFRRRKVTGGLQVQARVNGNGELDPQGEITCDSEIIEWTARRR